MNRKIWNLLGINLRWLVTGRRILYGDRHAQRTRAKRREIHALRKRHVRSIKRLHANPRDGYLAVSQRIAHARRKAA